MELFAIGIVVAIVAFGLWYQISKSETPAPAPVQAPTPKHLLQRDANDNGIVSKRVKQTNKGSTL